MMRTALIGTVAWLVALQCQAQPPQRVVIVESLGKCPDQLVLRIEVPNANGSVELKNFPGHSANCDELLKEASINLPDVSKKAQEFLTTYKAAYSSGQQLKQDDYRRMWQAGARIPPFPSMEDCGNTAFLRQRENRLNSWADGWRNASEFVLGFKAGGREIPNAMALGTVQHATFVDVTFAGSTISSTTGPIPAASVHFELAVSCERRSWAETSWEWLVVEDPTPSSSGAVPKNYKIAAQVRRK